MSHSQQVSEHYGLKDVFIYFRSEVCVGQLMFLLKEQVVGVACRNRGHLCCQSVNSGAR